MHANIFVISVLWMNPVRACWHRLYLTLKVHNIIFNINIRVYKKKTLKMTLDIDLPDFALWLMNLADFLYAHVKGIIISDQLRPRAKKIKRLWYF